MRPENKNKKKIQDSAPLKVTVLKIFSLKPTKYPSVRIFHFGDYPFHAKNYRVPFSVTNVIAPLSYVWMLSLIKALVKNFFKKISLNPKKVKGKTISRLNKEAMLPGERA